MARGRSARLQMVGVVGQEGQMEGVVGQEADGRQPDGAVAVGQGGPDGYDGGDGRVHEGQMARREGMGGCMRARWQLLGVVG